MSTQDNGEPAFPRDHRHDGHNGMTLRDYFAAKAMQGWIASDTWARYPELAEKCYVMADAMLKARQQ